MEGGQLFHKPGLSLQVLLEIRRVIGKEFECKEISNADFQTKLTAIYQSGDGAAQRAVDDMGSEYDLSSLADDIPQDTDLLSGEDDAPVIRLINAILSQAVRDKASDIHLEPFEDRVAVRFRVDGVLTEVLSPKPELAPVLVSRLKVMAKLDIAEKRLPQDGRISVKLAGHGVDIRVSTIPSAHGERVVLRLLDQAAGQLGLDQLNMPAAVNDRFKRALKKPHGIILVTGPTGSGKTTSLYAGLSYINDRSRNILTIEDPVEYLLPGIGQTQVNAKVDMTFARGLRAILRQDPDVVMVGEIRDSETASIAVQASLTGHLVLSTLHTNTAIGAITRLQDMGIEPFLLSSSIELVMAQRLVRVLCDECKQPYSPTESEQERFRIPADAQLYHPEGCPSCNHTGYKGRTGIYELIEIDDTLRQMIHESAGEQEMIRYARSASESIENDGRNRVISGQTSIEEVLRVTATA
ncbi:type II secretion system ATPase GspE [Aurantivibrio plasticivorans]